MIRATAAATRRRVRLALLAVAGLLAPPPFLATPASAQQGEWRNPYTGRIWNNPQSSLIDTYLHNDQQRRMMRHYYGADPGRQPHPLEQAPLRAAPQAAPRMQVGRQPGQQAGGDPSFRLLNNSPVTIREVYVSSAAVSNWGPDRLGRNVLPSGQALLVRLPAGMCVNDVRIVYMNGRALERRGVNTCAILDLPLP